MSLNVEQHRIQFYQEARDILDRVNDDILKAEVDPENSEILNSIFRGIHTIKGSAGVFDMDDVSQFTHHLEGILNALREGRLSLTPDLVDVILAGCDHISTMINDYSSGRQATINDELVAAFRSFCPKVSDPQAEAEAVCIFAEAEPTSSRASAGLFPDEIVEAFSDAARSGLSIFKVTLHFTSEMMENGYDPLVLLKNLDRMCIHYHAVTSSAGIPPLYEIEPLSLYLHPVVYVATEAAREEIESLAFDPSLITVEALLEGNEVVETGEASGLAAAVDPETFGEFLAGATEMLEALEKAVISYEETSSRDALNQIFRLVHNLKGDSDYIGLKDLTAFAHALESLLDRLRAGSDQRTPETVDLILQAVDFLKQSILKIAAKTDIGVFPPVFSKIKELLQRPVKDTRQSAAPLPQTFDELGKVFIEQALQYKEVLTTVAASVPLDASRKRMVQRSLHGLLRGSRILSLKTLEQITLEAVSALDGQEDRSLVERVEEAIAFIEGLEAEPRRIGELLVRDGKISEEDLKEALSRQKPLGRILVEEGKVSEEDVQRALKKQDLMETARQLRPAAVTAEPEMRTMRIDERKVEHFNNIIGELLIARNTYEFLLTNLRGTDGELRTTVKQLKDNLHLISRLTNEMHHGVMSLRMVPIRSIFQKFSRVARDISRKQRKLIELITDGEEIEIDKKVADMLTEPLVHIVRNACDHAIEHPEERKSAGKPEKGTVILRASQEGRNLTIRIIDDGKGIDRQRLYEKAQGAGLDVPSSLDDPSVLDLIFAPGLSTKSEVTDISGRGVGMDVVKTTARALGGTVHVISEEGRGTEITLAIPMAMGVSAALLVEAGRNAYAIPLDYLVETLKLPSHQLRRAAGSGLVFHYRGEVLPAERLDVLLKATSNGNGASAHPTRRNRVEEMNGEVAVVVIRTAFGKFGLIVDHLDKNMELAIKPAPGSLSTIDVISGVSIMGDGKILLVLNPEKLF